MATAIESSAPASTRNGRSAAADPDKPSTKKKFVVPIVIVLGLVLAFWAFQRWNYGRTHQSTDNAQANADKADADLARAKELATKLIISQQQLDAAQATAAVAHANLLAAERQASAAGGTVNTAEAGVRVASARTMAARAAAENAQLQLDYTRITAPASGEVSRKQVEVGQLVAPGQPLLSIVADTGIWVTANFKETQLATIRPGQPVEFEIDAYGGCVGEGKVASVSGATGAKFALLPPDNATGNFTKVVQRVPVRIAVTKPCSGNHPLRPGLSANVHVNTAVR
jgi:membrane fusion protein (multidrug efflux system)